MIKEDILNKDIKRMITKKYNLYQSPSKNIDEILSYLDGNFNDVLSDYNLGFKEMYNTLDNDNTEYVTKTNEDMLIKLSTFKQFKNIII